jgi:tetratricopeptide (TPR) repeat protein
MLEELSLHFKTPEEHYDYAVSLINIGDYVTAREHLDKLLKQNPKAEFVLYGLAALHCLTGHVEESLKTLSEAIQVKPALRFQARNDTDFQNLAEDPRLLNCCIRIRAPNLSRRKKKRARTRAA